MTKVEANLENRGNGSLEFADGILRFRVVRGRFRKKYEIVREIPLSDIENVALSGTQLSITWKGVADIFGVEKGEQANALFEEVESALKKQNETVENVNAVPETPIEVIDTIKASFEVTDSLFDILRLLHGRIERKSLEDSLKRLEENSKGLSIQETSTAKMDFRKLRDAIKEDRVEEISREVFEVLSFLYDYVSELASNKVLPEKTHPDYDEAKRMIFAYYTLNDIIIGTIVRDKEIERERKELAVMLEDLAGAMDLHIDVDAVTKTSESLVDGKVDMRLINENRSIFKQQFAFLLPQ